MGLLRSNLGIFRLRKFVFVRVYIDLPWELFSGSTFIHPRFIHTEKRVDKIQAAKELLRPENSRVQEFF